MGDRNNGNQRDKINLDWAAHLTEQSVLAFFLQLAMTLTFPKTIPFFLNSKINGLMKPIKGRAPYFLSLAHTNFIK